MNSSTNESNAMNHPIVSRDLWLAERKKLLAHEKELTHLRDQIARERRAHLLADFVDFRPDRRAEPAEHAAALEFLQRRFEHAGSEAAPSRMRDADLGPVGIGAPGIGVVHHVDGEPQHPALDGVEESELGGSDGHRGVYSIWDMASSARPAACAPVSASPVSPGARSCRQR